MSVLVLILGSERSSPASAADAQDFARIERGRYLATTADCAACHTLPDQKQPFAGGRSIETPFGMIVAPNITPDFETGIGAWTDDEFDTALREGRRPDGAYLYPAMPYPFFTKMSREDVLAIRAYLNTITSVRHEVEPNQLPLPFNIRTAMSVWNVLYFKKGQFQPDAAKSAEWNRGAYLVEGPGHCGACHTPKTFLGGDKGSLSFDGAVIQGWFAPNITGDNAQGIGRWSSEDLIAYLKTGHNRMTGATGPMAEVITLSTSRMTDPDLRAIATYLKDLPGRASVASASPAPDPIMKAGSAIYLDRCSACHALDGSGVPNLFPSLAASSSLRSFDPTTLIRVVLRGARSVATDAEPTAPAMPAFGWQLDDEQVAAVLTYVRNSWGGAPSGVVSAADVQRTRMELAKRRD
ncbi:cytochrome c [Microvirga sp. 2MCAF38]